MSLASAVVLLQTALALLTLVNANPSLPQSMRDNATAIAQHAISEAHAALAPMPTSADVAEDDIASPADEVVAQTALAKTPSAQTVSLTLSSTKAGPAYVYPNPTLTPGAELTTDASTICVPGYASSVRNVSTATKKLVYAEYSVSYPQPTGAYEVDHFIPLEIGGSNDIKNLWLEPASPTPGFHQKDQFENFEHDQVCKGKISAAEAQSRMVSDWYFYWEEEVEGVTATTPASVRPAAAATPASVQSVSVSAPAPQVTTTTADAAPAAYYTSSYHTAKYWYPASCSGWQSLSKAYLETFPTLEALLAKYPGRTESPGCF
jgi:hypothetical protein